MSAPEKQPTENAEVIRKLIILPETQVEPQDDDRSPTKTERDAALEVLAVSDAGTSEEVEVVRERVDLQPQPETEDGDRSPTKIIRDK